MACPTIRERYERLKREAEAERSLGLARRPPRIALPSLAGASRFLAGSRVRYNADAHANWRAHTMVGTVFGFHFKPEYKDRHICLKADWLMRVNWDDDISEHHVHPDWLEIVSQ